MNRVLHPARPTHGLYRPEAEHDSCGVAFVATMRGTPGRDIVDLALTALRNLDHRGAVGADPHTGDGAGILTQIPDEFLRAVTDFDLPPAGRYAVGPVFLPPGDDAAVAAIERIAAEEGLDVLGWRDVPVVDGLLGPAARASQPVIRQLFVADPRRELAGIDLDRRCFRLRKRTENGEGVYIASLSARTLVYKGMLTTSQLVEFFPDLSDERFTTALAVVHSRFSTNTFPTWSLAHPFRYVAHNGEINTVRGNRNWLAARQSRLSSAVLGDLAPLLPICTEGASDSASFDEVLELLHLAGRSLPHAVLMMMPEAWENNHEMDPEVRAFYEYHSCLTEAWDGPAALTFTDGTVVGAVLDRNGLRPGRFWVTDDGLVVLASETGVLDIEPARIVRKGRLEPGKMLLVDTAAGRIIDNDEIKADLAARRPYREWVGERTAYLDQIPEREHIAHSPASVRRRQRAFGYTEEELALILTPMAATGAEPLGSMGTDTPIAVLSAKPRLLFDYFTQMFAQVTNPPLDAIREELVTSLGGAIGPEPNLLAEDPEHARKLMLPFPVVDNDDLAKLIHVDADPRLGGVFSARKIRGLYRVHTGGEGLAAQLDAIFAQVDAAIEDGVSFIVLSDRDADATWAPIPSLLLLSGVHQHLVRRHTRNRCSLIVEAGDVREVHHVALLIGFGAAAVNPYLAMETVEDLARSGFLGPVTADEAVHNLIKALGKGVLKVMSKMGISTIASYRGAQTFEAVGLATEFVDRYFTGTTSRISGVGIDVVAAEVAARHETAYPPSGNRRPHQRLAQGGEYRWRRDGEEHLFDPETVFRLQHATRTRQFDVFREYTRRIDDQSGRLMTLRGLLTFAEGVREPIDLDEVEPVADIVKRFSTGAMSYGSISVEAHETLARAMNSIGARSNTGEGGEGVDRLTDPARRSRIKQVASGRFGVTADYLNSATDLQIKMAQGAKPGEGGQLPGEKVYPWIAATRGSTPGVGLISPPPHHDIYSIEDIAQLIHDLKNANPDARIHVKLVSEFGVGTVAAGVSKAHADVVLISGHDGGTGASPLTSVKHAGTPWEIGLAETQQTLVANDLRDRIVVQVDGQLKTGRDVVIAALLGAEEFGFATAPLVVTGCVLTRKCQLDTCPVGVATQNPELRARFRGKPEDVVTFFEFLASEVREYLAALGYRTLADAVGHVESLDTRAAINHWKSQGLDLGPILEPAVGVPGHGLRQVREQDHGLDRALDHSLIAAAQPALADGTPVVVVAAIRNVNRTVGTMLGHEVTTRFGGTTLDDDTIRIVLTGSAGQSLGAFLPKGVTLHLTGDANDYLGKGLSGGRIVVTPPPDAGFDPATNVVAGNVVGYGATGGQIFLRGKVGERFAVRNSGATLVAEGVGDHACEYMTGGTALILGPTGRNVAAGMSGGVAYLLDLRRSALNAAALADDLIVGELDDADWALVEDLLRTHHAETGSTLAEQLLCESARDRFTKLLPTQYDRMRRALDTARTAGTDLDAPGAWEQLLAEARHG